MLEFAFNKTCVYSTLNPQLRVRVIFELNFENFLFKFSEGGGLFLCCHLGSVFCEKFFEVKILETVKNGDGLIFDFEALVSQV